MKKNLILPISGLIILGLCAFFFLGQTEPKDPKSLELPPSLFETTGFYDQKPLKEKELDDFFIVNFFASWCKPCLAEHPLLMELKAKGIKVIGINFRDDEDNFNEWIEEHGNPFFHVIRDDGTIAYEMGLIGVPETYFIENLNIQKKIQGPLFYEDVEQYL
ncbi:redoxin domain-containing protein [Alphaproteobacteria bacterium]|jgi:cytochrome c biogenesis protein CcmG/thiol:disulfide interchange protein DsbE|nr:redoxin domain-containing protein [Alphaproteobacteria bacterium]